MPWICSGNTFLIILLQFTGRRKNSWLGLGLSWLRNLFRCRIFSEKNAKKCSAWELVQMGVTQCELIGPRAPTIEREAPSSSTGSSIWSSLDCPPPLPCHNCGNALPGLPDCQDCPPSGLPACRSPGGIPAQWSSRCLGSGRFESASSPHSTNSDDCCETAEMKKNEGRFVWCDNYLRFIIINKYSLHLILCFGGGVVLTGIMSWLRLFDPLPSHTKKERRKRRKRKKEKKEKRSKYPFDPGQFFWKKVFPNYNNVKWVSFTATSPDNVVVVKYKYVCNLQGTEELINH